VSNVVDEKSRTVPVIFEVSNPKLLLKAGMFANVAIRTDLVERGLSLPEEALFEDEGRFFVFVQTEGESFERREVKTGIRGAGRVQIREGIREDERVVARGGYYVKLASLSARMPQGHGHEH
jgi:multidrug efflux pump subunit AcrA (membrane-fusion protein)